MPLLNEKPFTLLKPPQDLKPDTVVYRIPFTQEILIHHQEYLNRLDLYRQSVWTCEITGKTSLTYEKALKSERTATEKLQQLPEELTALMLHKIQFSTLPLKDLVDSIYEMLREKFFEGLELQGKRGESVSGCRILEILKEENTIKYKVGWLDKHKHVTETAELMQKDLILKKPPCSRRLLKAFVDKSTYKNHPWLIHENLAKKHEISMETPHDLYPFEEGRKGNKCKGTENGDGDMKETKRTKYPIDDLLVLSDPSSQRPTLCTDFRVPIECAGYLTMVWDFCTTFSKFLKLSIFSIEDFENAICHKDKSNIDLIVESHAAILRLLIKEEGAYFFVIQAKKRNSKITLNNWTDFLSDFLEMEGREQFSDYLRTIRQGHYGLLDVNVKLDIYQELINEALDSKAIRQRIGDCMELQQLIRKENNRRIKQEKQAEKEVSDSTKDFLNGSTMNDGHFSPMESTKKQEEEKHTEKEQSDIEKELEKLSVTTNSLGRDRDYNQYWFLRHEGMLIVGNSENNVFGYYRTKEELDALISSLNPKGVRERALKKQLEKNYKTISNALEEKCEEAKQNGLSEEGELRRSARKRTPTRSKPSFFAYVNKLKEDLY